jgi:hypothetical protein
MSSSIQIQTRANAAKYLVMSLFLLAVFGVGILGFARQGLAQRSGPLCSSDADCPETGGYYCQTSFWANGVDGTVTNCSLCPTGDECLNDGTTNKVVECDKQVGNVPDGTVTNCSLCPSVDGCTVGSDGVDNCYTPPNFVSDGTTASDCSLCPTGYACGNTT